MKSLAIACAVLVAGLVGSAKAADVSKSTLAAMGFGKATIMSDADGLAVRGKGTSASVWGGSIANFNVPTGTNSATNGYSASSTHHVGSAYANGNSNSYAGNVSSLFGHLSFTKNISGGSAAAFAR